jgi:hypothetical protein
LGERHAYVLERGDREGTVLSEELEKNHHVDATLSLKGACYYPHPEGAEVAR